MQRHILTTSLALAALLGFGLATPAYADGRSHGYERGYEQGYRDAYRRERHHDRHYDNRRQHRFDHYQSYVAPRRGYVVTPLPVHSHDRYCGHRYYAPPPVVRHHDHDNNVGWSVVIRSDNLGVRF